MRYILTCQSQSHCTNEVYHPVDDEGAVAVGGCGVGDLGG
jgi:hypothetical protein